MMCSLVFEEEVTGVLKRGSAGGAEAEGSGRAICEFR